MEAGSQSGQSGPGGQEGDQEGDHGPGGPTTHRGLTYPFGRYAPAAGAVHWVRPDVGWLRFALPGPLGHVNAFVLTADEGLTIVDTGLNLPAIREAWEAALAGPLAVAPGAGRIARVIVTHCHPDHLGLAGWLAARDAAPVVMTRGEWLTGALLRADAREAVPDEVVALRRACGWDEEAIAAAGAAGWNRFRMIVKRLPLGYVRIRAGEELRIGARRWQVVVGAGHSPEHACLLDVDDGLLIAGDQLLPRISSNVSVSAGEPEADPLADWLDSLAMLEALGGKQPDLLALPGHGEPFTGVATRAAALTRDHRARLEALEAFCREAPRRVIDVFPCLFRRTIGPLEQGLASGEAHAHLRHLERAGRLTRRTDAEGVWWYGEP